jgi:hypothetical protein
MLKFFTAECPEAAEREIKLKITIPKLGIRITPFIFFDFSFKTISAFSAISAVNFFQLERGCKTKKI